MKSSRRAFLGRAAALGVPMSGLTMGAFAQPTKPVRIGVLIPLTGSTSQFGLLMGKAATFAVDEINAAGGIRGRKVELIVEDDQSNPEAGVRAAKKLIDVDRVVAICGTYASSVTSAIAPLCWESKTLLATASGADSITALPHQGYIIRTSPTSGNQGHKVAEFAVELGGKSTFFLGPQTPFAQLYLDTLAATAKAAGAKSGGLIYEDKKPTYRAEIDRALRSNPDVIVFGGYVPDTAVVMKDLFRAGYDKHRIGLSFGVNQKLLEALPAEVADGAYSVVPSAAVSSQGYQRLIAGLKVPSLDTFTCQVYDQICLVALALAKSGAAEMTGTTVRDNVRSVSQEASAKVVDGAAEGLKLLSAGGKINFDGASGPCEFAANGDIKGSFYRYEQIKAGKITTVKVA